MYEFNSYLSAAQYVRINEMIAVRQTKSEKRATVLLDRWFPLSELDESAIIGSFSITTPTKRYMLLKDAFDYGAGHCTPADIARDYLTAKFGAKRRRITTAQYRNFHDLHRFAPMYARPCELESASYVDIKSAYWSILSRVGWDVDYLPDAFIRVRSDVSDFPFPDMKLARNCLVSVGIETVSNLKIWSDGQLSTRKAGNQFVNKSLWSFVMDVLNAIARQAVNLGAVYCYTDGYIIDTKRERDLIDLIHNWGLDARIKLTGQATIKAPASYRVGDYESKPFRRTWKDRPVDKITSFVNRTWLRDRFIRFYPKT